MQTSSQIPSLVEILDRDLKSRMRSIERSAANTEPKRYKSDTGSQMTLSQSTTQEDTIYSQGRESSQESSQSSKYSSLYSKATATAAAPSGMDELKIAQTMDKTMQNALLQKTLEAVVSIEQVHQRNNLLLTKITERLDDQIESSMSMQKEQHQLVDRMLNEFKSTQHTAMSSFLHSFTEQINDLKNVLADQVMSSVKTTTNINAEAEETTTSGESVELDPIDFFDEPVADPPTEKFDEVLVMDLLAEAKAKAKRKRNKKH